MRRLLRWLGRIVLALGVGVLGLLSPILYIETMCRPAGTAELYASLLPAEWQRPEARTLLTYPEWHIVHAYDDYAEVIRNGDPHQFGFLRSIGGFWSSLCALSVASGSHGGFDGATKQTIYTIGVSFTAELLAKAGYEESLGRVAAWVRGPERAPLDVMSAAQAADYADFLQQVPWYKWDFSRDAAALEAGASGVFRDSERRWALGVEYRVKAGYARLIEAAVAAVGEDQLRLRAVVTGVPEPVLAALPEVSLVETRPEGVVIAAPRYRAFTRLAEAVAAAGGSFVEIAGNDDILLTVITDQPQMAGAIHSFARQGNAGYRHLLLMPVADLAGALSALPPGALEHIHDY